MDNLHEEFFYGTQEMAERTQLLEWVVGGGLARLVDVLWR